MPIQVKHGCGKVLRLKDELAGRKVKCPGCEKPFKVPEPKPKAPPKPGPSPADAATAGAAGAGEPGAAPGAAAEAPSAAPPVPGGASDEPTDAGPAAAGKAGGKAGAKVGGKRGKAAKVDPDKVRNLGRGHLKDRFEARERTGKSGKILAIVGLVVILGVGVGGWWMLGRDSDMSQQYVEKDHADKFQRIFRTMRASVPGTGVPLDDPAVLDFVAAWRRSEQGAEGDAQRAPLAADEVEEFFEWAWINQLGAGGRLQQHLEVNRDLRRLLFQRWRAEIAALDLKVQGTPTFTVRDEAGNAADADVTFTGTWNGEPISLTRRIVLYSEGGYWKLDPIGGVNGIRSRQGHVRCREDFINQLANAIAPINPVPGESFPDDWEAFYERQVVRNGDLAPWRFLCPYDTEHPGFAPGPGLQAREGAQLDFYPPDLLRRRRLARDLEGNDARAEELAAAKADVQRWEEAIEPFNEVLIEGRITSFEYAPGDMTEGPERPVLWEREAFHEGSRWVVMSDLSLVLATDWELERLQAGDGPFPAPPWARPGGGAAGGDGGGASPDGGNGGDDGGDDAGDGDDMGDGE